MMIIIVIIVTTIKIIMINNKGNREEKEREPDRAILYYYRTVTSEISNVAIFTNHIFYAHMLHKAKIQHYIIVFVIGRK